jgi:adenylosuccinate synthase
VKNVVVVVDLQYGSTGKGQIAGTLGRRWRPDTVVCANGPNAGHTYQWFDKLNNSLENAPNYRKVVHTVLPVTAVLPSVRNVLLGPGAVIDIARLFEEISQNVELFRGKRLIIHPNAAIVTQDHRDREKELIGIGSTMKGTAEAVIEKMRRPRQGANIAHTWAAQLQSLSPSLTIKCVVNEDIYNEAIDSSDKLLVEGAQGASLSIHSRFYPHTTSRDVSVSQIWADCRLPCGHDIDLQVVGVCRTYPIRVANRLDKDGNTIGYSGSYYPDQKEIEWSAIGREAELTTVTKLPRRLFTFSTQQILDSVRYNDPTSIALTFCDYLPSHNEQHPDRTFVAKTWPVGPGERLSPDVLSLIRRIEAAADCDVNFLSFGPRDTDVFSISEHAPPPRLSTNLWLPWDK